MIKWDQALVKSVHDYKAKNNTTIEKALAELKLPIGSFYNAQVRFAKRPKPAPVAEKKRAYTFKKPTPQPIQLEMVSSSSVNKVVILIADRSQVKSILSEVF